MSGHPSIFASWPHRVVASLIDDLLLLVSGAPMIAGLLIWRHDADAGRTTTHDALGQPIVTDGDPSSLALTLTLVGLLPYFGFWIWNRWARQGNTGRSLGKSLMGLRLLDANTARPPGSFRAFGREFAHYIDSLVCYLGWLWPLWDDRRQTLADKLCNTIVIVESRAEAAALRRQGQP